MEVAVWGQGERWACAKGLEVGVGGEKTDWEERLRESWEHQ